MIALVIVCIIISASLIAAILSYQSIISSTDQENQELMDELLDNSNITISLRDKIANLSSQVDELTAEVNDLTAQLNNQPDLTAQINDLTVQIQNLTSQIHNLTNPPHPTQTLTVIKSTTPNYWIFTIASIAGSELIKKADVYVILKNDYNTITMSATQMTASMDNGNLIYQPPIASDNLSAGDIFKLNKTVYPIGSSIILVNIDASYQYCAMIA